MTDCERKDYCDIDTDIDTEPDLDRRSEEKIKRLFESWDKGKKTKDDFMK